MAADAWTVAAILGLSAAAVVLMWTKVHSLIWFDPAWWLQEVFRFARGQVPNRDFCWQYPPLSIFVVGLALRWFGERFEVAQAAIDLLSLGVVFGCYLWARRLLPRSLHLVCIALVIAVGATTQTYFSLFSFLTYGPSLHVAACGILLLMLGVLRHVCSGVEDRAAYWLTGTGAAISLTSKPEAIVATLALFTVLAAADRLVSFRSASWHAWMAHYAKLAVLWFVPGIAIYIAVGAWAGFRDTLMGVIGYGLGSMACPWWPTGFGLLSAASALGLAAFVFAAATLVERRLWVSLLGQRRYGMLWAAAVAGLCVCAVREAVFHHELLRSAMPVTSKIRALLPDLLATSAIFRSGEWAMIAYWIWIVAGAIRARAIERWRLAVLLVLTLPVSLSIRSLFGTHMSGLPEIPAISYPIVLLLTPWVLLRMLSLPHRPTESVAVEGARRPVAVVGALVAGYIAVRIVGGWPDVLSPSRYTAMDTIAGTIHVRDFDDTRRVYDYVMAHTTPADPILEIPYGGGIGVATGRPSYSFITFWQDIPMPERYQERDLETIRAHPPRVIVAEDEEHFGSNYGVRGCHGCTFPEISWMPDRLSWRPGYVYPSIQWIEANYKTDARVGKWVLLLLK